MSLATVDHRTRAENQTPILTLFDILHNSLVLLNTAPFLTTKTLLNLAATSRTFRDLLYHTPGVFRYLDLSQVKSASFDISSIDNGGEIWRNTQLDENLTEDDFYSGPLRGIFSSLRRRNILQDVQTLILDGLAVTSDLCYDIINDPSYSVRLLSLREVTHLNHGKLRGALTYACRSSRPEGTPRLKGLYVFGERLPEEELSKPRRDPASSLHISTPYNRRFESQLDPAVRGGGDPWWSKKGVMFPGMVPDDWINCILACEGLIAFDAMLCRGPRHTNSPAFGKVPLLADHAPAVAFFALSACDGCGSAPEDLVTDASSPESLPLLAPPPYLSSSVRAATAPQQPSKAFVPRCGACLEHRYCKSCNKWWCESCYQLEGQAARWASNLVVVDDEGSFDMSELELASAAPKPKARISKSCWECGNNCDACIDATQKTCKKCRSSYCIVHNEGSSSTFCDWCVSRGRGLGRL